MNEKNQDDQDVEKSDAKSGKLDWGRFWILCLGGWIGSSLLIILGLMVISGSSGFGPFVFIFTGLIWLPITLVALSIYRNKGYKNTLRFIIIGVVITLFVVGSCFGSFGSIATN